MWPGYGAHMGWMWLRWLIGLGVVALLVWMIARAAASPAPRRSEESPETILKRRYARGEVEEQESAGSPISETRSQPMAVAIGAGADVARRRRISGSDESHVR